MRFDNYIISHMIDLTQLGRFDIIIYLKINFFFHIYYLIYLIFLINLYYISNTTDVIMEYVIFHIIFYVT